MSFHVVATKIIDELPTGHKSNPQSRSQSFCDDRSIAVLCTRIETVPSMMHSYPQNEASVQQFWLI